MKIGGDGVREREREIDTLNGVQSTGWLRDDFYLVQRTSIISIFSHLHAACEEFCHRRRRCFFLWVSEKRVVFIIWIAFIWCFPSLHSSSFFFILRAIHSVVWSVQVRLSQPIYKYAVRIMISEFADVIFLFFSSLRDFCVYVWFAFFLACEPSSPLWQTFKSIIILFNICTIWLVYICIEHLCHMYITCQIDVRNSIRKNSIYYTCCKCISVSLLSYIRERTDGRWGGWTQTLPIDV